jgi:hypothetical protein
MRIILADYNNGDEYALFTSPDLVKGMRKLWENKYNELLEKFQQYEDWNIRLQEFVNMSPEDREKYIEEKKINKEIQERFNSMMSTYNNIMGLMF